MIKEGIECLGEFPPVCPTELLGSAGIGCGKLHGIPEKDPTTENGIVLLGIERLNLGEVLADFWRDCWCEQDANQGMGMVDCWIRLLALWRFDRFGVLYGRTLREVAGRMVFSAAAAKPAACDYCTGGTRGRIGIFDYHLVERNGWSYVLGRTRPVFRRRRRRAGCCWWAIWVSEVLAMCAYGGHGWRGALGRSTPTSAGRWLRGAKRDAGAG